jgi:hypothetical protein
MARNLHRKQESLSGLVLPLRSHFLPQLLSDSLVTFWHNKVPIPTTSGRFTPLWSAEVSPLCQFKPETSAPERAKAGPLVGERRLGTRGVPQRLGCPDGRAEAGLAMLAVGRRALIARDGFSGFAGRLWASGRLPGRGPQTRRIKDSYSVLIALICCRGRGNCPDRLRRPDRRDARFPDL